MGNTGLTESWPMKLFSERAATLKKCTHATW